MKKKTSYLEQTKRSEIFKHPKKIEKPGKFVYNLDYKKINIHKNPARYRVGLSEQEVLLVEPYKSEILPFWRFKTPLDARRSSIKIYSLFKNYQLNNDFIGMDMCRKFLQMGYTRSRRYAKPTSVRPNTDFGKTKSAAIFYRVWQRVERNLEYKRLKTEWHEMYG